MGAAELCQLGSISARLRAQPRRARSQRVNPTAPDAALLHFPVRDDADSAHEASPRPSPPRTKARRHAFGRRRHRRQARRASPIERDIREPLGSSLEASSTTGSESLPVGDSPTAGSMTTSSSGDNAENGLGEHFPSETAAVDASEAPCRSRNGAGKLSSVTWRRGWNHRPRPFSFDPREER